MNDFLRILNPLYGRRFASLLFHFLLYLSMILAITACAAPERRVIKNPEMNQWNATQRRYVNLFQSEYGYLEETEFDQIEFRKPHEIGTRKYAILSDPRGDIDRSKGYDASEYTVSPELDLIHNPTYDVQITWIRHATFLIQLGGKYQILVDPVLAQVDGMTGALMKFVDFAELHAEPPMAVQELPLADDSKEGNPHTKNIVAISHDHYDHLNFNTLKQLPVTTHYYVPLGLEKEFPRRYLDVTGMDWYTKETLDDLTIYFLPANHRSGRSLYEMNQTLWGGWLFEWNNHRVYFAGDTAYSDVFKDIKKQLGEMDICLMPTTAWFQRHWHFAPEDAVQAAEDLGCRTLIPWGWGTWVNSFEHILEPPRRLQYAFDKMRPENIELRILKMGETVKIDDVSDEKGDD